MFLNDFSPLLFPALLNVLFGFIPSTPNHPSLYCSTIERGEVTSVKQKWAVWHFVKPCLRPSICFILKLGRPLRLAQAVELGSCPCTYLTDRGLHSNSLFLGTTDCFISRWALEGERRTSVITDLEAFLAVTDISVLWDLSVSVRSS